MPRRTHTASRRAPLSQRAASAPQAASSPSLPTSVKAKSAESEFVTLARIVRVRGRIGEVAATILTDFPDRLSKLREVFLLDPAGRRRAMRIRRCWLASSHGGQAIFHFDSINSINDAQPLVGCAVQVPFSQRAPLPAGRYFISDLLGCEVFEISPSAEGHSSRREGAATTTGAAASEGGFALLGSVRDVYLESGTPLLVVATPQGELLIPFADEICTRIDPAARRIEVRLPPGLRELNS